MMELPGGRKLR